MPNRQIIQNRCLERRAFNALQKEIEDPCINMDRQNREGGKTGSGHGLLTAADQHAHRRQRLLRLAMDTADLSKDPYVIRNHLGQWECVLCMTVHTNEGSYLAHTAAKKHQANLARRAAREAALSGTGTTNMGSLAAKLSSIAASSPQGQPRIGRPHSTLKRIKEEGPSGRHGILLHIHYPSLKPDTEPAFRMMSAFEQRLEAPNRAYQYLLVAAEPYETVAFKIPNRPIVPDDNLFYSHWDPDFKMFTVQALLENKS
jgi:splicing factor 3A subunit 2